jgi:hypothetical protein
LSRWLFTVTRIPCYLTRYGHAGYRQGPVMVTLHALLKHKVSLPVLVNVQEAYIREYLQSTS